MKKIMLVSLGLYVLGFAMMLFGIFNYFGQSDITAIVSTGMVITGMVLSVLGFFTNIIAFVIGIKDGLQNNHFTRWFYVSMVSLSLVIIYIVFVIVQGSSS